MRLKDIIDSYMKLVPEVNTYYKRCLRTQRWNGHITMMIVDAAFTSIGLNYFQTVVPRVEMFGKEFIEQGKIVTLKDLVTANDNSLDRIWKNKRSWQMAKSIAAYLVEIKKRKKIDDRAAFISWAKNSNLDNWQKDPIGQIKGVGINTFQYLRMMGGVDTVMPDKIVKKVIGEILAKANLKMPDNDCDFVKLVEQIARETGYKSIELCWMSWLIQSESAMSRLEKYSAVLSKI